MHLGFAGRVGVGRAGSGPLIGGAEATLAALRDLGYVIPFYLMGVTKVDTVIGCSVIVALRSLSADDDRMGIARADDDLSGGGQGDARRAEPLPVAWTPSGDGCAAAEIESGGGEVQHPYE